jgi:IS30 family transposase
MPYHQPELRCYPSTNNSGFHAREAKIALRAKRMKANQHHRKLPTNTKLVAIITQRLIRHDSPEQIAGWQATTGRAVRVCAQTIYDWIYLHAKELIVHLYCRKGKYRRSRENTLRRVFRNKQKEVRSIDARSAHILLRKIYGHLKGETVVGNAQSGSIATFVEP